MVQTNYVFAKRQRDLAKQRKKAEKQQRKTDAHTPPDQENPPQPVAEETAVV